MTAQEQMFLRTVKQGFAEEKAKIERQLARAERELSDPDLVKVIRDKYVHNFIGMLALMQNLQNQFHALLIMPSDCALEPKRDAGAEKAVLRG